MAEGKAIPAFLQAQMDKVQPSEERTPLIATLAAVAAKKQTPNKLNLFNPISLDTLEKMGTNLPPNTFSDRMSGIAYAPQVSNIRFKENANYPAPKWMKGNYRDMFKAGSPVPMDFVTEGPGLESPQWYKDQMKQLGAPDDFIKPPKISQGFLPPNVDGRYNPQYHRIQVDRFDTRLANPEVTAHELGHSRSVGGGAAPVTVTDMAPPTNLSNRKNYILYRGHPEEYVARRAADANMAKTTGEVAFHFNAQGRNSHSDISPQAKNMYENVFGQKLSPAKPLSLHNMQYGYSANFSQTDPTQNLTRTLYNGPVSDAGNLIDYEKAPLPEVLGETPQVNKASGIARKALGALAPIAIASQAVNTQAVFNKARKEKANLFLPIAQASSIVPIVEDLGPRTFNHATGEVKDKKWYEGGYL